MEYDYDTEAGCDTFERSSARPIEEQSWGRFDVILGEHYADQVEEAMECMSDDELDELVATGGLTAKRESLFRDVLKEAVKNQEWTQLDIGMLMWSFEQIVDWRTLPGPVKAEYICPVHGDVSRIARRIMLYKNPVSNQIKFKCPKCHAEIKNAKKRKIPVPKDITKWHPLNNAWKCQHRSYLGGVLLIRSRPAAGIDLLEIMEVGSNMSIQELEEFWSKKTCYTKLRKAISEGTVVKVKPGIYRRVK